jgi:hypothetical protein
MIEQRSTNKRELFKRIARIVLIIVKYSLDRRKYVDLIKTLNYKLRLMSGSCQTKRLSFFTLKQTYKSSSRKPLASFGIISF